MLPPAIHDSEQAESESIESVDQMMMILWLLFDEVFAMCYLPYSEHT